MVYIGLLILFFIVGFILISMHYNKQAVLTVSENSESQHFQKAKIQNIENENEVKPCADYSHGLRGIGETEISYGYAEINLSGGKREFGELMCKQLEIFNDFGQTHICPSDVISIFFTGPMAIVNATTLLPKDQKSNLQDAVIKCKNFLKVMKIRTDSGERIFCPVDSTMIFFKGRNSSPVLNTREVLVCILRKCISDSEIENYFQCWQEEGSSDATFNLEFTIIHEIIRSIVIKHIKVLSMKRQQMVFQDEYGVESYDKWNAELSYFFDRVLVPELNTRLGQEQTYPFHNCFIIKKLVIEREDGSVKQTLGFIDKIVRTEGRVDAQDFSSMSGHDYEHYVANLVRECGWAALVTKASGDHGADIIAEKKGVRLAIQCKLYTSLVGNKSVQEVYAAKTHYKCDLACVVTNSGFTVPAKEIASNTGVALVHHSSLVSFLEDIETNLEVS